MRLPGWGILTPKVKAAAPAQIPEVVEPAVMPDPDDKAIKVTQRRKAAKRRMRSGRLSTMDSSPQGTSFG